MPSTIKNDGSIKIGVENDPGITVSDTAVTVAKALTVSATVTASAVGGLVVSGAGGKDTINISDTTANQGITIGGDVTLFRSGANALATDDAFTAALGLTATAGGVTATAGNIAAADGVITQVEATADNAIGTVRGIYGKVTASGAAIASGLVTGVRGEIAFTGAVSAGGAYAYGAQGKLIMSGTMNHEDSRLCAVMAQLDTTGATLTTGQISGLWVDHGAGITGAGGGQFNMVRISNTVAGSKPNGVIYSHSDASYLLDLSAPEGNHDWCVAAGTGSGSWGNANGVATKVLVINLDGTPYYIPIHNANA